MAANKRLYRGRVTGGKSVLKTKTIKNSKLKLTRSQTIEQPRKRPFYSIFMVEHETVLHAVKYPVW